MSNHSSVESEKSEVDSPLKMTYQTLGRQYLGGTLN